MKRFVITYILNLINQEADREQNQEKLLNTLSGIDKEIEVSLRRDEKIYDLLRSLSIKNFGDTNPEKDKPSLTNLLTNTIPNLVKNLPTVLATALGSGGVIGGLLGAKGLGKFFGKDKVTRTTNKLGTNRLNTNKPSLLTNLKTKSTNFLSNSKTKLSTIGKDLGSKLSTAKTTLKTGATALLKKGGKFIPVVGTALAVGFTLKDVYDNAKEEFFGKDSQTKDMSTKIRNVITKTFSNFVSDLSFGLIDSKTIKDAIESFGNNLGDIANWIYEKASTILDLPKKVVKNTAKTIVDYTPEPIQKGFDWLVNKTSGGYNQSNSTSYTSSGGVPSTSAMNLAKTAQNRSINNKYTGGKTVSIQDITRGAGACYSSVWQDIKSTGLDKQGIVPKGGTLNANGQAQMSAYNFAEWANTEEGRSKLDRIQVGSKIVNGFVEGMLPGDIVVYGKNYETGHKHGHIEIVGTDGNLYSDFKNKPDFALTYLSQGKAVVYRLKTTSQKQSKLVKNPNQVQIKKPLVNLQANSSSMGANMGTSQKTTTGAFKPKINDSTGLKQVMFQALEQNESKNPTKLVKDPNVGFNFGKSQFNSSTNPEAWKKLGFSKQEIANINSGNFDKNSVQQRLLSKSKEIAELDQKHKDALYSKVLEQKRTLFESQGLYIKDPKVLGQIFDINNQYGTNLDKDSAKWMSKYSGSKEINLQGVMGWRKNRGHEGKIRPLDQKRRFDNINNTMESFSIPEINKLLEESRKQASINNTGNQLASLPIINNNSSIDMSSKVGVSDMLILDSGLLG